jgi:hypothetical protein
MDKSMEEWRCRSCFNLNKRKTRNGMMIEWTRDGKETPGKERNEIKI